MNIGQILRSMIGDMQVVDPKALELKIGQIVKGVVLQMFGEQDALVKIGDVQVRAKLEAPLKLGQVTLLQVQPETTGAQIVLKPLQPTAPITANTVSALLQDFGMKDMTTNRQLVQLMHQEGISLQKDQLRIFADLAKAAPASAEPKDWNQAVIIASQKGLPLSKETVQALYQTMFGKPPIPLLKELDVQIEQYLQSNNRNEPPAGPAEKQEHISTKLLQQVQEAVNRLQSAANPMEWSRNTAMEDAKAISQNPLKANVVTSEHNPGGQQSAAVSEMPDEKGNELAKPQPTVTTQGEKGQLPAGQSPNVIEESSLPKQSSPLPREQVVFSSEGKPEILTHGAIASAPKETGGIIEVLKSLGLDYEHKILTTLNKMKNDFFPAPPVGGQPDAVIFSSSTDAELKNMDNFKGMLLQISQSDAVPQAMKETAQQLLQQITGQQLFMLSDRTQLFSHITLFLPLQHSSGEQTAAIHIQSRKGKRGELDAQNCRLLFDLHMKSLGETVVDVQVLKWMVSLQIHNDHPQASELLSSAKAEIAASLSKVGYQLVAMKTAPFPRESKGESVIGHTAKSPLSTVYSSRPYKGVDVRI